MHFCKSTVSKPSVTIPEATSGIDKARATKPPDDATPPLVARFAHERPQWGLQRKRHAIGVTTETPGGTGKNLDRCHAVRANAAAQGLRYGRLWAKERQDTYCGRPEVISVRLQFPASSVPCRATV
jgi:hypothetical protein